jgi:hypothetical protein
VAGLADEEARWLLLAQRPPMPEHLRRLPPAVREIRNLVDTAPWDRKVALPGVIPVSRTERVWSPLRQLCFGLADGGPLPEEIEANTLAPRVSDPALIVARPDDVFRLRKSERRLLRATGKPAASLRGNDQNARVNLAATIDEAITAVEESNWTPPPEWTGDPYESRRRARRVLRACRTRLDAWSVPERDDSLIGRIATHLSQQFHLARGELDRYAQEYREGEELRTKLLGDLDEARARLERQAWTMAVPAVALVALIALPFVQPPAIGPVSAILALVTIVGAVGWAARLIAFALRCSELERDLAMVEARRRATMRAVRRWPGEAHRLTSVYEILSDWSEIIGYMIHHPFGTAVTPTAAPVDDLRTPEAFRSADSRPSERHMKDLRWKVQDTVFPPGWLTALYLSVYRESMRSVPAASPGQPVDADTAPSSPLPPDEDDLPVPGASAAPGGTEKPGLDRWNARHRLLRDFRRSRCARTAQETVSSRIRQALRGYPPEELLPVVGVPSRVAGQPDRVMPALDFLLALAPKSTEGAPCSPFSSRAFTENGQVDGRNAVERVWLWCPATTLSGEESAGIREHAAVTVAFDDPTVDRAYRIQVTRLDVSFNCDPADLAAFGSA